MLRRILVGKSVVKNDARNSVFSTGVRTFAVESKPENVSNAVVDVSNSSNNEMQKLLLDCGVHLGHSVQVLNPKMKGFLHGVRHGRAIFNPDKTIHMLSRATRFLTDVYRNKGRIFIVALRPDIAKLVYPLIPENPQITFIGGNWAGGTLTNWDLLAKNTTKVCGDAFKLYNKKMFEKAVDSGKSVHEDITERVILEASKTLSEPQQKRFLKNFSPFLDSMRWQAIANCGVASSHPGFTNVDPQELPSCVVVLSAADSAKVLQEAHLTAIPTIGVCDSNCDPDKVQYVIPGSDDSLRAQYLYARTLLHNIPSFKF